MNESNTQFENRKRDHIKIALDPRSQTEGQNGLDSIELVHEALPEMNFKEVDISTSFFFSGTSVPLSSPIFISSMTAGHEKGREINEALARLSDRRQILMGVGSQRRELTDSNAAEEWTQVRKQAPKAKLLGNIGISQLIKTPIDDIRRLVDATEAVALFVHVNPLQEALQPEGTPNFKNSLEAIENLAKVIWTCTKEKSRWKAHREKARASRCCCLPNHRKLPPPIPKPPSKASFPTQRKHPNPPCPKETKSPSWWPKTTSNSARS
jgi:isopentenyl-diphosphate delta-isomerase